MCDLVSYDERGLTLTITWTLSPIMCGAHRSSPWSVRQERSSRVDRSVTAAQHHEAATHVTNADADAHAVVTTEVGYSLEVRRKPSRERHLFDAMPRCERLFFLYATGNN
jgi:hypothetical protein